MEPWPQLIITDRDGHMNLWSMDLDGRDLRQHTFPNKAMPIPGSVWGSS